MENKITLELTRGELLMIQQMAKDSEYDYQWMEALKNSLAAKAEKAYRKPLMPTNQYKRRMEAVKKRYQGEVVEENMVRAEENEIKFFYEVIKDCYIKEECSVPEGILYSVADLTKWLSGMVKKSKEWQADKCFNSRIEVINGPEPMELQIYENIEEIAEMLDVQLIREERDKRRALLSFEYEGCKVYQIEKGLSFERILSDIT